MVSKQLFKLINNKKGLVGIKYLHSNGVLAVICHSPYASSRSKAMLEQEILKAYNRYYKMVYRESMGEFFHDESALITINKEDFKWLDYVAGQKETS